MKEPSAHIDLVDTLERSFDLRDWFKAWQSDLGYRHDPANREMAGHLLPLRETVLEALSDASAEQFLNPLAARHLRRYGRRRLASHDLWFWVRSEWGKVDLCYGLAPKIGFHGEWNPAWARGDTGDLGQIEAKVCYAHESPSDRSAKLSILEAQLQNRRENDQKTKGCRGKRRQRYHGLVWLFEHGGPDKLAAVATEIEQTAASKRLVPTVSFAQTAVHDDLERLWPAFGGNNYTCCLDIALFELPA